MKIPAIIILITQFHLLFGQEKKIDGRILASVDLLGVPKAKIETLDKKYVADTDEQGRFTLTLPLEYDSLLITSIGHEVSKVRIQADKPVYEILWSDADSIYETKRSIVRSRNHSTKRETRFKRKFYKKAIRDKAFES